MDARYAGHLPHSMDTINPTNLSQSTNHRKVSDHARRAIRFELLNVAEQPLLTLYGLTCNLLNRCVSLKSHGKYANNPEDIDETYEQYLSRKEEQLNIILSLVVSNKYSFMFFQEIDIFTLPKQRQGHMTLQLERHKTLQNKFFTKLRKYHWEIIITERRKDAHKQRPLAMIYDTRVLSSHPKNMQGVFPFNDGSGSLVYNGYACDFTHRATGRVGTFVNLHLEWTADYTEVIPQFQQSKINQDIFTIMGGDTNHAPNKGITGMIANALHATSLGSYRDKNSALILTLKNTPGSSDETLRCHDGFFASPTRYTSVRVVEWYGERLELDQSSKETHVISIPPDEETVYRSPVGKAWVAAPAPLARQVLTSVSSSSSTSSFPASEASSATLAPSSTASLSPFVSSSSTSSVSSSSPSVLFTRKVEVTAHSESLLPHSPFYYPMWQPVQTVHEKVLLTITKNGAYAGSLSVKFPHKAWCDAFFVQLGGSRHLPLDVPMHAGCNICPLLDSRDAKETTLLFPIYWVDNGLAVLFPDLSMSRQFNSLLFANNREYSSHHNIYPTVYILMDINDNLYTWVLELQIADHFLTKVQMRTANTLKN